MALDFQIENGMLIKWSNGAQLTRKNEVSEKFNFPGTFL